mmetsp:Transcript_43201/g.131542  ORF Transcript_43201/g.131542 Transcript_43201/m.131542 type:complete len:93 (+) Transcript_43201:1345-1623(+)
MEVVCAFGRNRASTTLSGMCSSRRISAKRVPGSLSMSFVNPRAADFTGRTGRFGDSQTKTAAAEYMTCVTRCHLLPDIRCVYLSEATIGEKI